MRDYLRQQGINADHFHDDQAALNFLLGQLRTSAQQIDEMRYWAGLGQAAYAAQQHGAPEPAAQTAPQAPGAPQEPAWKKLWQVPEWREEWANDVHWNPQTGRFEPNHQYVHPKIVQAANERQAWKKQALDKLLNNPFDLVWEGTQDRIQQLLEEREQQILEKVAQIFQNRQQDQFVIETVNQNASWMYERDANGNLIMDPHPSGQAFPRLSQHGRRYAECIMWLKKQGIVDPQAQHEGAMRMMGSMLAGAPQQAPQAPGAPQQNTAAQERRDRFLNRAAGAAAMGPSQTGTMTDWNNVASPPQNTRLDFGAMLDQTMAERGLIPATG